MKVNMFDNKSAEANSLLFQVAKNKRGEIMANIKKKTNTHHDKEVKNMVGDVLCDTKFAFHAIDGQTFRSILNLTNAIDTMSDDTYYFHVTDAKNDFYNWIKEVFQEKDLAAKILSAKTKDKSQIVLLKWILQHK